MNFRDFTKKRKPMNKKRAVLSEQNLRELCIDGDTESDGIKFLMGEGNPGENQVVVSDYDLNQLVNGEVATSNGLSGLEVEYILQDIGYDRIYKLLGEYKSRKD